MFDEYQHRPDPINARGWLFGILVGLVALSWLGVLGPPGPVKVVFEPVTIEWDHSGEGSPDFFLVAFDDHPAISIDYKWGQRTYRVTSPPVWSQMKLTACNFAGCSDHMTVNSNVGDL